MNIISHKKYGKMVVTIHESRLDASLAPDFRQYMEELIGEGETDIVLNLEYINFMDSSSLGAIASVLKMLSNKGSMVVTGVHGVVKELFTLTRMDRIFNIVEDVEHALESASAEA